MKAWKPLLAIGLCAAALALGGCILSPRDPDGPPEEDATDWETPTNTSIVLENLKAAMEGESPSNYRDCYTEDFRFHVDPQDSLDAGQEAEDLYANWTREDEEQAANGIFGDASSVTVSFVNYQQPDESLEETYRIEDYTLTVAWQSGPNAGGSVTYEGRAILHMREDGGRWAIFRWADGRTTANPTWGFLRGQYR